MTVFTPNILQNNTFPNLKQVDLNWTYELLQKRLKLSDPGPKPWRKQFAEQQDVTMGIDEKILSTAEMKEILKEEKHFDMVIVQFFNPVMLGLAAKFKCPLVRIILFGQFI